MQTLPPTITTLLESGAVSARYMLRMDPDTGPTGVWGGDYTLLHGGVEFGALAGAMAVSSIPGETGLGTDAMDVTITGLSTTVLDIIAASQWHQRPAIVSIAFLDGAGAVTYVHPLFSGYMDTLDDTSSVDGSTTLLLRLESNSRELGRANGRTRSDGDQRRVDSLDGLYRYTGAVAANNSIYWGRKGPQSPFA